MHLYRWRSYDSEGRRYRGEYYAESPDRVAEFLQGKNQSVIDIRKVEPFSLKRLWRGTEERMNGRKKAGFFRQLYVLLDAGIPLIRCLGLLERNAGKGLRDLSRQLQEDLRRGFSFTAAMERQVRVFSPMAVALVRAGEEAGQLPAVVKALADYYRQQDQLMKFVRGICVYPAFLLVVASVVFLFFCLKLLPLFLDLYISFGLEKTTPVYQLNAVSSFVGEYKVPLFCSLAILARAGWQCRKFFRRQLFRFPKLGKLRRDFFEVRFLKVLSLLLGSGIPLTDSIRMAAVAIGDKVWQRRAGEFSLRALQGAGIYIAAKETPLLFSGMTLEFIAVGESTGSLPEMLAEAGKLLEEEFLDTVKNLKKILEPVMILVVAVLVFGTIGVMISPLLSLLANLPGFG